MRQLGSIGRGAFAAAVALTLGFGVTQALAAPPHPARLPVCDDTECSTRCQTQGYMGGHCDLGRCFCDVPIQP